MRRTPNHDTPATWGRMTMGEGVSPTHTFLEEPGKLALILRGESLADLVTEGGRALGSRMRGQAQQGASGPWVEVQCRASGRETLLAEWLNRLLALARRDRWAPVECQVLEVSDSSLHARVRGVPLPGEHRLGKALIRPDSLNALGDHGLQVEVTLEAPDADAGNRVALTASASMKGRE